MHNWMLISINTNGYLRLTKDDAVAWHNFGKICSRITYKFKPKILILRKKFCSVVPGQSFYLYLAKTPFERFLVADMKDLKAKILLLYI